VVRYAIKEAYGEVEYARKAIKDVFLAMIARHLPALIPQQGDLSELLLHFKIARQCRHKATEVRRGHRWDQL